MVIMVCDQPLLYATSVRWRCRRFLDIQTASSLEQRQKNLRVPWGLFYLHVCSLYVELCILYLKNFFIFNYMYFSFR